MKQELAVDVRFGRIHCSSGDDYMSLTLEDRISGIEFARLDMSFEQFAKAITGSESRVKGEFIGLENIGKKREYEKAKAIISDNEYTTVTDGLKYDDYKEALAEWLKTHHAREGWHMDTYLGSRDSVQRDFKSESHVLNFGYYRYVAKQESVS